MWKIPATEGKENEIKEKIFSSLQWKEGTNLLGAKVTPPVQFDRE